MRTGAVRLYRGLFWVVGQTDDSPILITRKVLCDANGTPLESADFDSKSGDSFNHRKSWPIAAQGSSRDIRREAWNHFPRGRVEIRNGTAVVYHNPILADVIGFEDTIIREFMLISPRDSIRFAPDLSSHYECDVAK